MGRNILITLAGCGASDSKADFNNFIDSMPFIEPPDQALAGVVPSDSWNSYYKHAAIAVTSTQDFSHAPAALPNLIEHNYVVDLSKVDPSLTAEFEKLFMIYSGSLYFLPNASKSSDLLHGEAAWADLMIAKPNDGLVNNWRRVIPESQDLIEETLHADLDMSLLKPFLLTFIDKYMIDDNIYKMYKAKYGPDYAGALSDANEVYYEELFLKDPTFPIHVDGGAQIGTLAVGATPDQRIIGLAFDVASYDPLSIGRFLLYRSRLAGTATNNKVLRGHPILIELGVHHTVDSSRVDLVDIANAAGRYDNTIALDPSTDPHTIILQRAAVATPGLNVPADHGTTRITIYNPETQYLRIDGAPPGDITLSISQFDSAQQDVDITLVNQGLANVTLNVVLSDAAYAANNGILFQIELHPMDFHAFPIKFQMVEDDVGSIARVITTVDIVDGINEIFGKQANCFCYSVDYTGAADPYTPSFPTVNVGGGACHPQLELFTNGGQFTECAHRVSTKRDMGHDLNVMFVWKLQEKYVKTAEDLYGVTVPLSIFPSALIIVELDNDEIDDDFIPTIISHEMGHWFALVHYTLNVPTPYTADTGYEHFTHQLSATSPSTFLFPTGHHQRFLNLMNIGSTLTKKSIQLTAVQADLVNAKAGTIT